VKVTFDGIAGDGSRIAYSYTAKFDGKDYPEVGVGTPNGADTIALKRIDDYTVEATLKKAGKIVQTTRAVLSKDGKVLTNTSNGTNVAGKPINTVAVYEKQ
jgi:restriction endonuclease S subunit